MPAPPIRWMAPGFGADAGQPHPTRTAETTGAETPEPAETTAAATQPSVQGYSIAKWEGALGVAAVNGPASTLVSGEAEAVDQLIGQLADDGIRAQRIAVAYASHSRQVEAVGPAYDVDMSTTRTPSSGPVSALITRSPRPPTSRPRTRAWTRCISMATCSLTALWLALERRTSTVPCTTPDLGAVTTRETNNEGGNPDCSFGVRRLCPG